MKISLQFQYMPDERHRPLDAADHNEPIEGEAGKLPIPDVGDTVSYEGYLFDVDSRGKPIESSGRSARVARKVKTRHFSYYADLVVVNIVVTDVTQDEMLMRLKD